MNIKELKLKLENNNLEDVFFVFEIADDTSNFIVNQYIHKICELKNLEIKFIESFNEIPDNSFIENNNLYIINIDRFNESTKYNNCIIICNKSDLDYKIKIPKLEDWEVIDYVAPKIRGIEKSTLSELIKLYSKNYFRFLNDIDKLSIFNESVQKLVFNDLINSNLISNVSNLTIWDLSNGIIKKDINKIIEVLKVIDYIDIEPLGLLVVLYKNFKNIINIQSDYKCTAAKIGITDKQFYAIKKYNCGIYSNDRLIEIFKILTNAEYLFKYNELSLDDLIDYLICKICRS